MNSKFEELKIFIEYIKEEHNFEFSAVCYQECQFKETVSTEQFNLENYKLIPEGKPINPCSAKGGLIIYLHDNFKGRKEMTLNTYST